MKDFLRLYGLPILVVVLGIAIALMFMAPAPPKKVTIAGGAPMDRDQMMEVFLATLRAHGYVAIPSSSGAWRIAPDAEAAQQPSGMSGERFVTQVMYLYKIYAFFETTASWPNC